MANLRLEIFRLTLRLSATAFNTSEAFSKALDLTGDGSFAALVAIVVGVCGVAAAFELPIDEVANIPRLTAIFAQTALMLGVHAFCAWNISLDICRRASERGHTSSVLEGFIGVLATLLIIELRIASIRRKPRDSPPQQLKIDDPPPQSPPMSTAPQQKPHHFHGLPQVRHNSPNPPAEHLGKSTKGTASNRPNPTRMAKTACNSNEANEVHHRATPKMHARSRPHKTCTSHPTTRHR